MAASSYRGTSVPGARVSAEVAGPGKGVGRGVAGNANRPFAAIGLLLPVALLEDALFSAPAAVFVVSAPAPLFFCWAHNGKAKSALIASTAHPLRITFLLSLMMNRIPFGSHACLVTARSSRRAPLSAFTTLLVVASSSPGTHFSHINVPTQGEKPRKKGRSAVRLFHNSLSTQLLPRSPAAVFHAGCPFSREFSGFGPPGRRAAWLSTARPRNQAAHSRNRAGCDRRKAA